MVVYKLLLVLSLALMAEIQAQKSVTGDDYITNFMRTELRNITDKIASEIQVRADFCLVDGMNDWNKAFNYTNWDFMTNCMKNIQGDVRRRLCTKAEIQFYLNNYFNKVDVNYMKTNRNCNSTSWVSGCEPGWACSSNAHVKFDSADSHQIPARTLECSTCCEGFFCPQGLTCMMPCPLGSYCPLATLNISTGLCEPYLYQLPHDMNHTCGGADAWADFDSSEKIFCPGGSYCPTTTEKKACDSGYYCQTGSTSKSRCSMFISCKGNNENQNIRAYGIFFTVASTIVLFIVYKLSRQHLANRDQKRAKYRMRAATSVQQSALVRAKWRVAKDAVLKQAAGLRANLSQRFSSRSFKILRNEDVKANDLLLDQYIKSLSDSEPLPSQLECEFQGSVKDEHLTVNQPCNHGRLGLEIEDKNSQKKNLEAEEIYIENQIFDHPYAQIEKHQKTPKLQCGNQTFPEINIIANGVKTGKRPQIEINYKDLTLTLKGKEKCLLKNLTGKIMPARITAVMGPSGSGKTTFISALAGKATGCTKSGLILINGKPETIQSYRKIVGFVPQDDIVHGNLTVEENLLFSACCRLSTFLSREDKVMIVERIIYNLGLQEVCDSIVGTVEQQGISGGERKRLNVGLEMVVEPSVLFLDEPTSGLDSSSSRQLLKTLQCEALAGVNICMVVHQPSYALFKMFDDLILLANGGLMVYNGLVSEVEEYFAGLGINVPEHVNPPDYYIDLLESSVGTSTCSKANYELLSIRWKLHEEMQYQVRELEMSHKSGHSEYEHEINSFSGKWWRKDLSNRRVPGVILQYKYFLERLTKQRLHEAKLQAIDYLIILIAGACLGAISKIGDIDFGTKRYPFTIIAISLLCQIAALRTFSLDKLQYMRECGSGMSSFAHFLAKDTLDLFNTVIKPIVYLSMFYSLTNPRSTFLEHYIVLISVVYCVTGISYAFAIFFNPASAQLLTVMTPVCLTLISTQALQTTGLRALANLFYPKWALEALVIANARRYHGVWLITRCGALSEFGYNVHHWSYCIMIIIIQGIFSRFVAFIGLLGSVRK